MAEENVDRLSCLSDDVCHHILSFLPCTKHRARTSLLSKSWRHLWAHHPVIRLGLGPGPSPSSADITGAIARAHARAVDQCLHACRAANLEKLDIDLWSPPDHSPSEAQAYADATSRWFNFAASRSVKILCITGRWEENDRRPELPVSIFNCRSLQTLRVSYCNFPEIPSDFPGFGSLKTLHMHSTYITRKAFDVLLCTSPALESLALDKVTPYSPLQMKPISLCLRYLKKIDIDSYFSDRIDIDAPRLDSIVFSGDTRLLSLGCAPMLTKAHLFDDMYEVLRNYNDWMGLISAVSQAESLRVNGWFFQFKLRQNHPNDHLRPMFKNLKQLYCELYWLCTPVLHAMASVLRECPSLSDLHVRISSWMMGLGTRLRKHGELRFRFLSLGNLSETLEGFQAEDSNDPSDPFKDFETPLCHLKAVTIDGFSGAPGEIQLVKFILEKGVSLKTLTIRDWSRIARPDDLELILPSVVASSNVEIHWKHLE